MFLCYIGAAIPTRPRFVAERIDIKSQQCFVLSCSDSVSGSRLQMDTVSRKSGDDFIVDTSAGLIFTVDSTSADITYMKFNAIEVGIETSPSSRVRV
ncbi:hypothetical protein CPB85DRAFT_1309501 [Mucidula mucida]|nr:hypothetical protein CPB85DRAFT_1309501 [Mucidula mucida]